MTITPEHRAAISLNNTGVALLQRRCYTQGFATLRDAVAAMSSVSRRINQQEDGPNDGDDSSRETPCVSAMIHQAAKRLAKPELSVDLNAASQYDLHVLSDCENPPVLQEYPHQDLSTPSLHLHNQVTPSVFTATPSPTAHAIDFNCLCAYLLRIEALDGEVSAGLNYELQASVILQNFGVAHRLMAGLTDDPYSKLGFHVGAMNMFTLSYSIMMNSCERHLRGNLEEMALQRFVFTSSLILQNLVELSALLGLHHYGREYKSRLEDLRKSARDVQDCSHEGFAAGAA
jgi:hypothetical protein